MAPIFKREGGHFFQITSRHYCCAVTAAWRHQWYHWCFSFPYSVWQWMVYFQKGAAAFLLFFPCKTVTNLTARFIFLKCQFNYNWETGGNQRGMAFRKAHLGGLSIHNWGLSTYRETSGHCIKVLTQEISSFEPLVLNSHSMLVFIILF